MSASLTLPAWPRRVRRWGVILGGVALFLWLRVEDNDPLSAVLAGWAGAAFFIADALFTRFGGRALTPRPLLLSAALAGAVTGGGAVVLTALLMLLKNGLHGHVFPDYPFPVIVGIIERAPAWIAAGALGGLGLALLLLALRRG